MMTSLTTASLAVGSDGLEVTNPFAVAILWRFGSRPVSSGSWSCEKHSGGSVDAVTISVDGGVGSACRAWRVLCLELLLVRVPAVLGGSATGCGRMSATTMS
jgi:hypothetical protein